MPRVEGIGVDDCRALLRQKALKHSLFYMRLHEEAARAPRTPGDDDTSSVAERAPQSGRASRRVCDLVRNFEPAQMQYLRPPRPGSPVDDNIASSDEEDRAAVRRRSRDLSDDSAVELEPRFSLRRHSTPRARSPPPLHGRGRDRTLVEAHVVQLGRRGSEGEAVRGRCVRTPSVVVSDYCDSSAAGATKQEVAWLRAHSADSACSSTSTLSSRDEDFLDLSIASVPNKMYLNY